MIRVLAIPSGDYLARPFPQRENQIFERLHDQKNFEVHVLRFRPSSWRELETSVVIHDLRHEIRLHKLGLYYLLNALGSGMAIRRIVRNESIDVIITENIAPPFAYSVMEQISSCKVPVVFDMQDHFPSSAAGYLADTTGPLGRVLMTTFESMVKSLVHMANVVTVPGEGLARYARLLGADAVRLVPNGVPDAFLTPRSGRNVRSKLQMQGGDIVVGYTGSIEFWLDMQLLFKSIFLAKQENLPVKLLLVGRHLQTRYHEKVRDLLTHYGLGSITTWLEWVPHQEIVDYISAMDVAALPFNISIPTAYYASPIKLWEYLSQSKPVISTPFPEAMLNSDCLSLASNPDEFLGCLKLVAHNDKEVMSRARAGYQKAMQHTWSRSVMVLAEILRKVVRGEPLERE